MITPGHKTDETRTGSNLTESQSRSMYELRNRFAKPVLSSELMAITAILFDAGARLPSAFRRWKQEGGRISVVANRPSDKSNIGIGALELSAPPNTARIDIRPMTVNDLPAVAALAAQLGYSPTGDQVAERFAQLQPQAMAA